MNFGSVVPNIAACCHANQKEPASEKMSKYGFRKKKRVRHPHILSDRLMKKILLIIICSILSVIWVQAQDKTNSRVLVTHYGVQDGLPHSVVNCSLKSDDGFIWFGTWYGLSRFDGTQFHNFTTTYSPTSDQPPRKVETIVEDKEGNIWIKTLDWKLSVFFKHTERFENIFKELQPFKCNLQIIKIQATDDGHVLLLTKDKNLLIGVTRKDGSIDIKQVVSSRGFINTANYQLTQPIVNISHGRASYVGHDYTIYSVPLASKGRKDKLFWRDYFDKKAADAHVYHDRTGGVWRMEGDKALTYHNPKTGERHRYPFTLFGRITEPSFCDAGRHGIFFLTAAGEALHIDSKTMQADNIAQRHEMADDKQNSRYFSMNLDRDSILWLTTASNGVFSFSFPINQFRIIRLPNMAESEVKSLFQHPNGDIWAGAKNKNIYVLDSQGHLKQTISYADEQIGSVYYMMADHEGNLWLSTKGDGIVKAVKDKSKPLGYRFEHYRHHPDDPNSISSNNVYMSLEDSKHRIWVCTLDGGLNLIEQRNEKTIFRHKYNGMNQYPPYGLYMEVRNIVEDAHRKIWVGTIDGLMTFDSEFTNVETLSFTAYRFSDLNTRANSDVYALYKDREKNIWLCSFGGGLSKITGFDQVEKLPLFKPVGLKEGLQSDVIFSIIEDRKGWLWLGNEQGVACYDPDQNRIRNFGRTNGFPKVELSESVALLTSAGEVWMGCDQGILAFHPDRLQSVSNTYKVYIVNAEVNNQDIRDYTKKPIINQSITYTDRLVLNHNQSMFTLEFAALNYKNPEAITYRYRLDGYDKDWHYSGKNRIASYTNVPPGTYQFVVETIDASNPGNSARCTMEVKILPPWWATWWAYLIYTVLFVLTTWLAIRYARYAIRMRNDVYVQTKLTEFKRKFYMEQQDLKFIEEVNRFIADNLTDPNFDINMIATGMKMSRSAFFKKLKGMTGLSPQDFVKEYKLNHAVELMQNPDISITDVAYLSGFNDAGYFGKCFKKKFGMSPREFMQSRNEAD